MTPQSYLICLGREVDLCFTELTNLLQAQNGKKSQRLTSSIVLLPEIAVDVLKFQKQLGGVIKIAQVVNTLPAAEEQALFPAVEAIIKQKTGHTTGKVPFAVTIIGEMAVSKQELQAGIKSLLASKGRSARFIEGGNDGLSSVQLHTQRILEKGFELLIVTSFDTMYLATTVAFQDYGQWNYRDYGRPRFNPKRGMLPPKVARMMVNIAKSLFISANNREPTTAYDPFCGEGTILTEAITLGLKVIGSDFDTQAVFDTQENVKWIAPKTPSGEKSNLIGQIFHSDIGDVSSILKEPVDLIVSEPFLGPNTGKPLSDQQINQTKDQFSELFSKLLTVSSKIQKSDSIVGVIVPSVQNNGKNELLLRQDFLDTRENFGYTPLVGPLVYSRPGANILRNIYFFKKAEEGKAERVKL